MNTFSPLCRKHPGVILESPLYEYTIILFEVGTCIYALDLSENRLLLRFTKQSNKELKKTKKHPNLIKISPTKWTFTGTHATC